MKALSAKARWDRLIAAALIAALGVLAIVTGLVALAVFNSGPSAPAAEPLAEKLGQALEAVLADIDSSFALEHHLANTAAVAVSNARISGNNDNPGRDSVMLYTGLIFPF